MKIRSLALAAASVAIFASSSAYAATNLIVNGSFETLPLGSFTNNCGPNCNYNYGPAVPGWINTGAVGQFQSGNGSGIIKLNYIPDGFTAAYSNGGGVLSQNIGTVTAANLLYKLSVYFGIRQDDPTNIGSGALIVGSNSYFVNGSAPAAGEWSLYTTSFVSTPGDVGKSISVALTGAGGQSLFDDAVLTASSVPEPATWAMMLLGFGMVGFGLRSRRKQAVRITYA